MGRGSGFGVGEVGLPGGNGELGAAEEERRRAKLGDAVVWRGPVTSEPVTSEPMTRQVARWRLR